MSSAHFIFIPGILMLGMVFGFFLGGRAARDAMALQQKREEERKARREARKPQSP